MPKYNWDKCLDGITRYINKDEKPRPEDDERFDVLQDEYFKRFGLGERMEEYLRIKILLVKLRSEYINTGDGMLLNQISIEELNLKNADPNKFEGMTTDQALVHLSKWLGTWIDKRKITVAQFTELMHEYGRSNKKE